MQFYRKMNRRLVSVLYLSYFLSFCSCTAAVSTNSSISAKLSKVWGPGLEPQMIMPARYFFVQGVNDKNESLSSIEDEDFSVRIDGISKTGKPCRIWTNNLNRKDGSLIIRYKVYESCTNFIIEVWHDGEHVGDSPYTFPGTVYSDDCDCSRNKINSFLESWKCGAVPQQVLSDLSMFGIVNWHKMRKKIIDKYDQPHSISLCHYVLKDNNIYRNCYGKYVGFKMFMDSILLSLSRKTILPDLEFFVNLGDWPLVHKKSDLFPIFSWCGSTSTHDIIMPTYDITESSLENMGRVTLDMLSVQGNVKDSWENRIGKIFWRGRDSNEHRLELISISKKFSDLFNVSLTNFFFFRDKQDIYGPKTEHVSFFRFFDYKYQLNLDGTVAAYRFPYLLAGGSLVMKQESQYYEYFYNELEENYHYISVKRNLEDLVEKIQWAKEHEQEAHKIAKNGQKFANDRLLPQQIFCYYAHLLNEFSKRIVSDVQILENMEKVDQIKLPIADCGCKRILKDEL